MAAWLRVTYVMAKRELWSYALSPVTYLLATLFLLAHGYSFWLLTQSLSARQASVGTLLSYFFGGTFLYWFFLLFVIAVVTMRLFAPSQESGLRHSPRELLLSTDAPEGALVLGKHLGATALYCALWAPTVTSLLLLRLYGGPAASLPGVSVLCGYLGVFLTGQSALALGLLASVLAPSQLVSATATFVALSLLLLSGLAADAQSSTPWLHALLGYANPLSHMDELARGIIDSRRPSYHLSSALLFLVSATLLLRVRPGNRRGQTRAALRILLCLLACVALNLLAARKPWRSDLTQTREYGLTPALQSTLRSLPQVVHIVDLTSAPEVGDRDELDQRFAETLLRAEQAAPDRLHVQRLHIDRQREQVRLLAERYHLDRDDLRAGVVLVYSEPASNDRDRAVHIPARSLTLRREQLADFERAEPHTAAEREPILVRYHGEVVLDRALRSVTSRRTPTICFTRGHGESEHDSLTASGGSELSLALRHDGMTPRALTSLHALAQKPAAPSDRDRDQPADRDRDRPCDLIVISGPERPFLPEEVSPLAHYLDHGGRLLVLSGALLDRELTRFLDTGLEGLLSQRGLVLGRSVVLDPPQRLGDSLAFIVEQGYAAHPATLPLLGRRTLWPLTRTIATQPSSVSGWQSQPLIHTSEQGRAESDLQRLRAARSAEPPPPAEHRETAAQQATLPIAAVSERAGGEATARIVVLGSSQLAWNDTLVLYNRDLLLSVITWLVDAPQSSAASAKQPSQIRLVLTAAQQQRLFVLLVLGVPLLILMLGVGIRWLRLSP
jgi:ABC-2 type transport system permease protein